VDEIVRAALRKWPNVPHCYGWLALDQRGQWFMRDDRVQRAGPFPAVKGSRIDHEKLRDFIHRNYAADERGAWYFQNGPQRVYVQLEAAPWVWRLTAAGDAGLAPGLHAHTGQTAIAGEAWLDEFGRLYLDSDRGVGVVHPQDMHVAADAVETGVWSPRAVRFADLPGRFGFEPDPKPPAITC
jgi:Protein of unknown function (DUF2946)